MPRLKDVGGAGQNSWGGDHQGTARGVEGSPGPPITASRCQLKWGSAQPWHCPSPDGTYTSGRLCETSPGKAEVTPINWGSCN